MTTAREVLPPASDFPDFLVSSHTYKTVSNIDVRTSVHIPKALIAEKSGEKRPVILRFHGGFLFTGGRLAGAWPKSWVLKLALAKKAVVVSADYRLMPEAKGVDILQDLGDTVQWLGDSLPAITQEQGVTVDTANTLVTGESAGGWCSLLTSIHFASSHPGVRIRACCSIYGVLDLESPFFTTKYEKVIVGTGMQPSSLLDEQVARIKAGEVPPVCPGVPDNSRTMLAFSAVQNGRFCEFLGTESELYPFKAVVKASQDGQTPPPIWLLHGKDDTAVPYEDSVGLAKRLSEQFGDKVPYKLTLVDGEHGMDIGMSLDTDYLVEGRQFFEQYWG